MADPINSEEMQGEEDKQTMIADRLSAVEEKMDRLLDKDIADNETFGRMYEDVHQYQTDTLDKQIKPVLLDLVQALEYGQKELAGEENPVAEHILDDIRDILDKYDVEPFESEGETVDPKRNKIIKVIPTADRSLDKKIAQRFGGGYMYGGKLLKTERVSVYRYEEK